MKALCALMFNVMGYLHTLLEEGEMSAWISVNDDLPMIGEPVLAMRCGEPVIAGMFEEPEDWESDMRAYYYWDDFNNDGQGWEYNEITHWMPLPAPPEDNP